MVNSQRWNPKWNKSHRILIQVSKIPHDISPQSEKTGKDFHASNNNRSHKEDQRQRKRGSNSKLA